VGQVSWKIFIQHTYQNLLKLVEIWQSFDRNKTAQFFWDGVFR